MSAANAPVFTALRGTNTDLIREVARLYLKPGMVIADVTYGRGVFWRKVDLSPYSFYHSDLQDGVDFRRLPHADESFDVVVLDPPYAHNPGPRFLTNHMYRNRETTETMSHRQIMTLYREGMQEAFRVLKTGGQHWVKCADEIESGHQYRSHQEIHQMALELGFQDQDLFVLSRNNAVVRVKTQQHARKNHSYLWIFTKGKRRSWPVG